MNFLIYTYWFSNDSFNVTKIEKIKYSINQLTLFKHILTKKCEKINNKNKKVLISRNKRKEDADKRLMNKFQFRLIDEFGVY